ncbi:MAG: ATP-binding protein [Anaerolineaceae bacterium]
MMIIKKTESWFERSNDRLLVFISSIRFRLTIWTAAILSLILLGFSIFIYSRQVYDLQLRAETQLQLKTQTFETQFRQTGDEESDHEGGLLPGLVQLNNSTLNEHDFFAVFASDGRIIKKAGQIEITPASQLFKSWQTQTGPDLLPVQSSVSIQESGEHTTALKFFVLATPLFSERKMVGLIVIGQLFDPEEELPRLLLTLIFGSIATMVFALVGGFWVANRAMAPVRTITRTARGISETGLNKRLRLAKKDELGELADTFDAMLDRLQAAFERQRQFTADASHELRTPLTIINLEAEQALAKPRSGSEYERALGLIRSEADVMAHLVNDLLILARMDAGQTQLHLEVLDLSDLALEVVERLTNLAHRGEVQLTLQDLPEVRVMGDRQYLSQAIFNLVENAIKYAGGGGKHVSIETGFDGENRAWIQIEDDGPGIPPEHLPHLFDRFYQVEKARTRGQEITEKNPATADPNGSGLGLSIVDWIVTAHNGNVSALSTVGQGSVFKIDLPAETRP